MTKSIPLSLAILLAFSPNASAVRPKAPQSQHSYQYLRYALVAVGVVAAGMWWSSGTKSAPKTSPNAGSKPDLSTAREKGVTTAVFRYPNLLLGLQKLEKKIPGTREVLVLGPGIASSPTNAVPQMHEIAPFFKNDHITVVDNSQYVLDAIRKSQWGDFEEACMQSIVERGGNFENHGKDVVRVQNRLRALAKEIPSSLKDLNMDLILSDFTQYNLKPDSIDIMIATKSLAYGYLQDKLIMDRYLDALKIDGEAFFAIEEFTAFTGGQPRGTKNHLEAFAYFKRNGELNTLLQTPNGKIFQVSTIDATTEQRDPTGGTWAIRYYRPDTKERLAFAATSPIFVIKRVE